MKVRYITVTTEVCVLDEIEPDHSISGFGTNDAHARCLEEVTSSEQEFDWNRDYVLIDPSGHEDPRMFVVADPVENETLGNATWTVFGNEHGGNCCEHYLAGTKEGWILNFGGEYPTWSEDRGLTWQEYRPTVFSQFGCLEPKPTVPGQEGLGEGSIVQATNGDLISMGWFPYPSTSGADQFYAFFYDAENQSGVGASIGLRSHSMIGLGRSR